MDRNLAQAVHQINHRAIKLLNGLIEFKENILEKVECCTLFTTNYPLLIKHIIREAELYHATVEHLITHQCLSHRHLRGMEEFWTAKYHPSYFLFLRIMCFGKQTIISGCWSARMGRSE